VLLALAGLFFLSRGIDLARHSPWDEVYNWYYAELQQEGLGGTPGHWLTYGMIAWHSVPEWGLAGFRLPFFVLTTIASAGLVWWCYRRGGAAWATGTAVALLLNPFTLYHGSLSNHYAALFAAGVAGLWASAALFEHRGLAWWWRGLFGTALVALATRAHELAVVPLGAVALAWWLSLAADPSRALLRRLPSAVIPRWRLVILGGGALLALGAVAVAAPVLFRHQSERIPGAAYFELHPAYLLKLLARLFGGFPYVDLIDQLTGLLVFAAGVSGWLLARSRRELTANGAGLFLLSMILVIVGVFGAITFRHSFHPRYIIFVVPVLLAGFGYLLREVWDFAARRRAGVAGAAGHGVWLALAALAAVLINTAFWAPRYFREQPTPLIQALALAKQKLPPGAVLASRNVYTSQALNLMAARDPDWTRRIEWLGERSTHSRVASMRALHLAATNSAGAYTLDMRLVDEPINTDYYHFSRGHGVEIGVAESSVPYAGAGFDADMVLRRIPDLPSFGTLPMPGSNAMRYQPLPGVACYPAGNLEKYAVPNLVMRSGAGATWWIRSMPAEPLAVDLQGHDFAGKAHYVVGTLEQEGREPLYRLWEFSGEAAILQWPPEWQTAQPAELHLFFPRVLRSDGGWDVSGAVTIQELRAEDDSVPAPASAVSGSALGGPEMGAWQLGTRPATRIGTISRLEVPLADAPQVVVFPFEATGTRGGEGRPVLIKPGLSYELDVLAGYATSDTQGRFSAAYVVEAGVAAHAAELRWFSAWVRTAGNGELRYRGPHVLSAK
jgi:hypothetical protein